MKRTSLVVFLTLLVLLAAGGVWKWATSRPQPGIRFVEFRNGEYGRVAVFEIFNHSDGPFSYPAYVIPFYRTAGPAGWQNVPPMTCHMQATLLPHSSQELVFRPPAGAFQVGIPFTPCTAEEFYAKPNSLRAWLESFSFSARVALGLPLPSADPFNGQDLVWSNTIQVPGSPSPTPSAELMACRVAPIGH